MDVKIDTLPELGTKAAAVAAIESLIFRAIGAKDLEPLQLRYWLDAYYQVRLAAVGWMETPHQSPAATASPQGEAQSAEIQVDQFGFEKEGDGAAVSAPPEQADASYGPEDGGWLVAAPTEAEERKPKQKPVGWTDGFEAVEVKRSGAAEATAYKREQFERLQRLRGEGVSTPEILKAAEGNISEDQLRGIMECRRVPVAVYRVLQAALDQVEKNGLPRGARCPRND